MSKFRILKGGLPDSPVYEFVDAAVTDTRLMGVLGLKVHYLEFPIAPGTDEKTKDVYHFYYYDIEEIGLDSLSIFELDEPCMVSYATKSCFGGLGANMVPVSEKEAKYLIKTFIDQTRAKNQPLPDNWHLAEFAIKDAQNLDSEELSSLNEKICTKVFSDYGVVNYYLMRSFAKDTEGMQLLQCKGVGSESFEDIGLKKHATFLRNKIEPLPQGEGVVYLSESLVETENSHYIVTSEIAAAGRKVLYAKKLNEFAVSVEEASMILARGEFCTVYRIVVPLEDFDVDFATLSLGTTKTEHECGDMYMEFKEDNLHVEEQEFKLYNDLKSLFFVSDYGELIVAAYSAEDIKDLEHRIKESLIMPDTMLMAKIQVARSILFDFAQSGCPSFAQYIQSLEN